MLANSQSHFNAALYARAKEHADYDEQPSGSEKCHSQSSRCNGSNKYCEEYSFNKQDSFSRDSNLSQPRERQVYRPGGLEEGESFGSRNPQLIRKYSSIFNELQEIDSSEVIHLFLEEIQQNQKCKEKLQQAERHMRGLEEEIAELKSLLEKKREAIRKLCETESNNLNLIQCLQRQGDRQFNWDSHFLTKYRELETYMNEYISSTNEAQEEFTRNFKLLRTESQRLATANEQLHKERFEGVKQLELVRLRVVKCEESLNLFKEKERTLTIQLDNLQEENGSLRKEIEELLQTLQTNEQFEVELTKENRQLPSELDFIREKINENQSLSRDIFEKMEENSEINQKLVKDKEQLEALLSNANQEHQKCLGEKEDLALHRDSLIEEVNSLREANERLLAAIEEKQGRISDLQGELRLLKQEEEELLDEYQNEKESKQLIKSQLMELADQVKFMESTYKKEINQNEKIKEELQRFWERNGTHPQKQPLSHNQNYSNQSLHSMQGSKVSQGRTLKDSGQHQSLF